MWKSLAFCMLVVLTVTVAGCGGSASSDMGPTPTPLFLEESQEKASAGPVATATPTPTNLPSRVELTPQSGVLAETPPAEARSGSSALLATTQPRVMALGVRPRITLYSRPDTGASIVTSVAGSQVMWADARSQDAQWVHVRITRTDGSGTTSEIAGWVAVADLDLFGDDASLPEAAADGTLVTAAPTPTAAGAGTPSAAVMTGQVTAAGLNVRGGPGVDQPIVGALRAGDTVSVIGRSREGDWLNIEWPGREDGAWVAAPYVELGGQEADLPVLGTDTSPVPAPASEASSGKIVFQTAIGQDIYLVNANGTGLRRLTSGMDPALSPDGTRVAYARWDSPHGLFVMDLRTGQEERVATANEPRGPTWSPNGDRLAFVHKTGSTTCRSTPYGCFSDDQIRSALGGQDCADTPTGRMCIDDFPVRSVTETGLAQITLADRSWQDLPYVGSPRAPQWHPSNEEILYQASDGVQVTVPNGSNRLLFENRDLSGATWSPDGQKLVAQIALHDHSDIFLVDRSGNIIQRLTEPPPSYERTRAPNNVAPTWSPDGRYILFLSDRDDAWRLYRMNADGSDQVPFLPNVLADIELRYDFAAERVADWAP